MENSMEMKRTGPGPRLPVFALSLANLATSLNHPVPHSLSKMKKNNPLNRLDLRSNYYFYSIKTQPGTQKAVYVYLYHYVKKNFFKFDISFYREG